MELTERQKNLIVISAFQAKGDLNNLQDAIEKGLDGNLTVSEVKEVFSQLYAYTGFPRSLNGLEKLQEVLKKRKTKGIKTELGKEPDIVLKDFDSLKEGTKVQMQLTGGEAFNYKFAPAIDYYLKAHLFGDIFARDNLSFVDRELVTVSALSAMEGVMPQLIAHVKGALNIGLKDDEIRAIPSVLKKAVGYLESRRVGLAIASVFGEAQTEEIPVKFNIWPIGNPNTVYAKYFTGNSYLASLANGGGTLPIVNVTFEPGCRNNWHIHHLGGQILICVSGRGWYQEWGKRARELREGAVVDISAEVKHWHGAATDSWFQHIALNVPFEGATSEWLEPVSDEYYKNLE